MFALSNGQAVRRDLSKTFQMQRFFKSAEKYAKLADDYQQNPQSLDEKSVVVAISRSVFHLTITPLMLVRASFRSAR